MKFRHWETATERAARADDKWGAGPVLRARAARATRAYRYHARARFFTITDTVQACDMEDALAKARARVTELCTDVDDQLGSISVWNPEHA